MSAQEETLRPLIVSALKTVSPDSDLVGLDSARSFRDQFDIDSVDFLNFIMSLERQLGLRIPEIDFPKLSSLDGCLNYLAPRLAGRDQH